MSAWREVPAVFRSPFRGSESRHTATRQGDHAEPDLDRLKRIRSVRADIWFLRQPHELDQPAGQLRLLSDFDNIGK